MRINQVLCIIKTKFIKITFNYDGFSSICKCILTGINIELKLRRGFGETEEDHVTPQ
jgi:hypothetical protein